MHTSTARPIAFLALAALLAGCATSGGQTAVSGYGAVAARSASALFAPPSAEAALGEDAVPRVGLAPELAALLEPRGRSIAEQAQHQALEGAAAGVTVNWRTPDGSARGTIVPGPLYAVNVQTCRDFSHEIELRGQRHAKRATACREGGGGWVLIS